MPPNTTSRTTTNFAGVARPSGAQEIMDSAEIGAPALMKLITMFPLGHYDVPALGSQSAPPAR